MASPIYFFTRSGCIWCQKMKPSIDKINETLNDEQKIEILSIDDQKSKTIYNNIIRMNKLQNVVPLMYNSNIGTTLLGYKDIRDIRKFLKAEPIDYKKPLTALPHFDIKNSSIKDLDKWKKDVILWYEVNKANLPSNVVDKEKMIDMVYKQFMAYRTKPLTIEERFSKLEEQSQEYNVRYEKMNKDLKKLKLEIKRLKNRK
jgi:thiol-disulfide isomerase/thioredoxin